MEWKIEYSVGDADLDRDHMSIFNAVDRVKKVFENAVRQMELRLEAEADEGQQRDFRGEIEQFELFRDGITKLVENIKIEIEVVGLVLVASAGCDIFSGLETYEY